MKARDRANEQRAGNMGAIVQPVVILHNIVVAFPSSGYIRASSGNTTLLLSLLSLPKDLQSICCSPHTPVIDIHSNIDRQHPVADEEFLDSFSFSRLIQVASYCMGTIEMMQILLMYFPTTAMGCSLSISTTRLGINLLWS